jgi:hypothetical protein
MTRHDSCAQMEERVWTSRNMMRADEMIHVLLKN